MQTQDTSAEDNADLQLEIAHLLLIDIVGYSKLLVNEQIEAVKELNRIVRSTNCFRKAEEKGKLIRLPTGDGMALLFFQSPEEPARCALEISDALRNHPGIRVRMGVHSGPVNRIADVNDQSNFAGTGINIAQRVMDCGDAGHILLSNHVAEDLAQYSHWQPFLHNLGECEVKHGLRLNVVNLYKEGLGNPNTPEKLRAGRRSRYKAIARTEAHLIKPSGWPGILVAGVAVLSIVAVAISAWMMLHRPFDASAAKQGQPVLASISAKSIAVLPFESLSDDKQDSYFADGVQDEILTDLAKLRDLKVISRTSVMQYRGESKRNLREIAKALGVNYVLEGSVQRDRDRVRVSSQLIDARSDTHVWGDRYDRPLADVFTIQSEVAERIVGQLSVTLSPAEKTAIHQRPTSDLVAYDLYVRAKDLIERSVFNAPRDDQLLEAINLLGRAIERDENFVAAYYQLAHAHDQVYFIGTDHTPARLALAEAAIQEIRTRKPDSAEAHLALAKHLYWANRDYDGARRELAEVGQRLPNDPWPYLIAGYMDRRQNRWDESTRNLERALQLDPRNFSILQQIAITYEHLRRYSDAMSVIDRALAIAPNDVETSVFRADLELYWKGDLGLYRATINSVLARHPAAKPVIAGQLLTLARYERSAANARDALSTLPPDGCRDETLLFPRAWCEGRAALLAGDQTRAQTAFVNAREAAEKAVREQPAYPEAFCILGAIEAFLGDKDRAIAIAQRATQMVPVDKDSIRGAKAIYYLAVVYSVTGETDLAFQQLAKSGSIPCGINYADLLFNPFWDNLRKDPRFAQLVASLEPKNSGSPPGNRN